MGFELAPDPGDRGEPDVKLGRAGGEASGERPRLLRNGVEVLARGALACPRCAVPIAPAPRARPRERLRCGYCGHDAETIEFLARGVRDTAANDVVLVARVA